MATYVIGDVQGCLDELLELLDRVDFEPGRDRLCFVGDLVNRGPRSLDTLRFVRGLGDDAEIVLGNHDLHLLAVAHGTRPPRNKDTFDDILGAPDLDDLLGWLRRRQLAWRDEATGWLVVHAGLPPEWSAAEALQRAAEIEAALRGSDCTAFLTHMYGDRPDLWADDLAGFDRLRYITNALTRIRYVDRAGRLIPKEKGPPPSAPAGLVPWYAHPERRSRGTPIVFGHWATHRGHATAEDRVEHVDGGCVWGGALVALRLEDRRRFQVPSSYVSPGRVGVGIDC